MGASIEVTQNWETSNTNVWLNQVISELSSLGSLKTQFLCGPRINLAAATGAKADFDIRGGFVFLFAK